MGQSTIRWSTWRCAWSILPVGEGQRQLPWCGKLSNGFYLSVGRWHPGPRSVWPNGLQSRFPSAQRPSSRWPLWSAGWCAGARGRGRNPPFPEGSNPDCVRAEGQCTRSGFFYIRQPSRRPSSILPVPRCHKADQAAARPPTRHRRRLASFLRVWGGAKSRLAAV